MITIYSPKKSTRLEYACKHLFHTILGSEFQIITERESSSLYDICYAQEYGGNGIHIIPHLSLIHI